MNILKNNVGDEKIKKTKDKKENVNYNERYKKTFDNYRDALYGIDGLRRDGENSLIRNDVSVEDIENLDSKEEFNHAVLMYEGKEEFDKKCFLEIFEKLYNHEIMDLLSHNDYYNLCDDKDFIMDLMECSGAVCEIACFATKKVIKQILEDKELLQRIDKKEILVNSNLCGNDILSIFILQLMNFKDLTQDKVFMTNLLKNISDMEGMNIGNASFNGVNFILKERCEDILKEKDFTENVFDFLEGAANNSYLGANTSMSELGEVMLTTPELSSNKELADRYVNNFRVLYNIDKSLIENEEFMEKALEYQGLCLYGFELPSSLYSNTNILENYLKQKEDLEGINFDVNNSVFAELFEKTWGESVDYCMRTEIANAIEQNNRIVVNEENSSKYDDAIDVLQQWAEDNDLIKIGHKLDVVKVPKGEIKEGDLNIGNGENNKNCIDDSKVGESTIILNGDTITDTLKKIGIDNRFLERITDLANQKKELGEKEESAKVLLEQYEQLQPNNTIDIVQ